MVSEGGQRCTFTFEPDMYIFRGSTLIWPNSPAITCHWPGKTQRQLVDWQAGFTGWSCHEVPGKRRICAQDHLQHTTGHISVLEVNCFSEPKLFSADTNLESLLQVMVEKVRFVKRFLIYGGMAETDFEANLFSAVNVLILFRRAEHEWQTL